MEPKAFFYSGIDPYTGKFTTGNTHDIDSIPAWVNNIQEKPYEFTFYWEDAYSSLMRENLIIHLN